jgi:hypothetical protein
MPTSTASVRGWVLLLALTFGGCALASATGYQPAGSDGGYSQLQLAPDMYRIAFQGNTYTSQDRVADMALLRAAELALAQGAPYFVVLNQLRESRSFPNAPYVPFPYASYGYAYSGPTTAPIIVRDHRAELAIKLLRGEPDPSTSAYSATLLRQELRLKYALDPK